MDAQNREKLSACVGALRHIQEAMAAGEAEWAHALTITTLDDLRGLKKAIALPMESVKSGFFTGIAMAEGKPIVGRGYNALIGALMGWFVGQIKASPTIDDVERLIEALDRTRTILEEHLDEVRKTALVAEDGRH